MFLTGSDDTSHIVTMRSTFSIESDGLSRGSVHAFTIALGLQLREIEAMSAYSMEIGS